MQENIGFLSIFTYSLSTQNNWPSLAAIGQFFYILLVVAFVALLAFYSTRLIASARAGRGGGKRNLEIIESLGIGAQSAVQIVRAGEKYFLVGVSKERVTLLAELSEEQLMLEAASKKWLPDTAFDKLLQRFLSKEYPSHPQDRKQDSE